LGHSVVEAEDVLYQTTYDLTNSTIVNDLE